MKIVRTGALAAAFGMVFAAWAAAAPLKLTPANPQPSGLNSGLAVTYAYPIDVKSLDDASSALKQTTERGRPLSGLNYPDRGDGAMALTSRKAQVVAAAIRGYIKFDAPGVYTLEFFTNDGLRVSIGGQRVAYYDERDACGSAGARQVEVPQAGWYPLEALYFQRLGTACLQMEWSPPGGGQKQVPNGAFGY